MKFIDEGSGDHPADHEFHAFLSKEQLSELRADEKAAVALCSEQKNGGFIVPLERFSGELFDKLLHYKIYDFLPWETERPLMLDKSDNDASGLSRRIIAISLRSFFK